MNACAISGCSAVRHYARGLCKMHYDRQRQSGDPGPVQRMVRPPASAGATCETDHCLGKPRARGLCDMHYQRWRQHGSTDDPRATLAERLDARLLKGAEPGACWVWTGATLKGYGQIGDAGVVKYAHRVAYELAFGPIPDGLMVCHRCDNPPCCNPDHLFTGTALDNVADMVGKGRGFWQREDLSGRPRDWHGRYAEDEATAPRPGAA